MDEAERNPAADHEARDPQAPERPDRPPAPRQAAWRRETAAPALSAHGAGRLPAARAQARQLWPTNWRARSAACAFILTTTTLTSADLPLAERVEKELRRSGADRGSAAGAGRCGAGARRKHRSPHLRLCNLHARSGAQPARHCRAVSHRRGDLRALLSRTAAQLSSARVRGRARRAVF